MVCGGWMRQDIENKIIIPKGQLNALECFAVRVLFWMVADGWQ